MKRRALPYREGDQIAVPQPGGWALGVIARSDGEGVLLGYFFGPILSSLPTTPVEVQPADVDYITRFGHLGLLGGTWPIIGQLPRFSREGWPVPLFGHRDALVESVGWLVSYDESLAEIGRNRVPVAEVGALPQDGLAGHIYLEQILARRLGVRRRKRAGWSSAVNGLNHVKRISKKRAQILVAVRAGLS